MPQIDNEMPDLGGEWVLIFAIPGVAHEKITRERGPPAWGLQLLNTLIHGTQANRGGSEQDQGSRCYYYL